LVTDLVTAEVQGVSRVFTNLVENVFESTVVLVALVATDIREEVSP